MSTDTETRDLPALLREIAEVAPDFVTRSEYDVGLPQNRVRFKFDVPERSIIDYRHQPFGFHERAIIQAALQEAIREQPKHIRDVYTDHLWRQVSSAGATGMDKLFGMVTATAQQQARAFLEALITTEDS